MVLTLTFVTRSRKVVLNITTRNSFDNVRGRKFSEELNFILAKAVRNSKNTNWNLYRLIILSGHELTHEQ